MLACLGSKFIFLKQLISCIHLKQSERNRVICVLICVCVGGVVVLCCYCLGLMRSDEERFHCAKKVWDCRNFCLNIKDLFQNNKLGVDHSEWQFLTVELFFEVFKLDWLKA